MRRFLTLLFRIVLVCTIACCLALIVFIGYLSLTQYNPSEVEYPVLKNAPVQAITKERDFSFFSWNIGYAGLGRQMDFFYEGGTRVRPKELEFRRYFKGILGTLKANDSCDFIFIQEADFDSKRSYYSNEGNDLAGGLQDHCYAYGKNYDSRFVPVPLVDPMGKVVSGILSFSSFLPYETERIDFGTRFSWPKRLVFLKRCFLLMRFHLNEGKDLVIINTHNSVFDEDGKLRKKEMKKLNQYLLNEYQKGNFVVAGGDWNQNPRRFSPEKVVSGDQVKLITPSIDEDFVPGWQFVFDPTQPTNRDVDHFYQKGVTKTTIIDFFVVSPNIEVKRIKTLCTGFENSDHQPVLMQIKLR